MREGLLSFKAAMAGIMALLIGAAVVPTDDGGVFNQLRQSRPRTAKTVKPAPAPAPAPTPAPTPPPTTGALFPEESLIQSNFDVNSEIVPSWGTGKIAASAAPDLVGAFRFICNAGQLLRDDPIVYPGQPGRSHLHQFYGNTGAKASSTYSSLRTSGESTCMSPLNRSAYWMPAMLNGRGQVVRPDYVSIYYKRLPISSPKCRRGNFQAMGNCIPLPNGLKFVFGYDMLTGKSPTGSLYFNCDGHDAVPGKYPDIVSAARNCPTGARLGAIIEAPQCWDGKNLDSPNHRDHVAYSGYGTWGYLKCPDTHPYVIPTFTMGAWYMTDATLDRSGTWEAGKTVTWSLSSDAMAGMPAMKPGSTFHADWFGAWDNNVMAMWMDNCINLMLNCSGGDLGNGKQMRMYSGFSWTANPRLVPIPD